MTTGSALDSVEANHEHGETVTPSVEHFESAIERLNHARKQYSDEERSAEAGSDKPINLPNNRDRSDATSADATQPDNWIHGTRLWMITLVLGLSLFLSNIEVSIVSTSVVSITNELHGFDQSGWLVTAYLITYTATLMIWATLAEVLGRKSCVIAAMIIFVIFSGACSAAQTMTQLIVFRAFQGIGGAGIYTIPQGIAFELVPSSKYPLYGAIVAFCYTMGYLFGPIWGGAINDAHLWRWIFLFMVPAGFVGAVVWIFVLPNNFPNHYNTGPKKSLAESLNGIYKIDFTGVLIALGANVFMIVALQEAGIEHPWRSAFVIVLLILSGFLWIGLLVWSWMLAKRGSKIQSVLPWRLLSREFIGILGSMFFCGTTFAASIYLIPQRYIVVNNLSALQAGLRLLPFTLLSTFTSVISSVLSKKELPLVYLVLVGNVFQVVGFSLLTTLPVTQHISAAQYGYEILAGAGAGPSLMVLVIMVLPFTIPETDKGIGNGAINQMRYLGSAISLAIIVSVLDSYLISNLSGILQPADVARILRATGFIETLAPSTQETVRQVFGRGYNLNMRILAGLSAAQIPWVILMSRKKQMKFD